jgi:hypothetical protein
MMNKYRLVSFFLLLFISISAFSQKSWVKLNEQTEVIEKELEYRDNTPSSFNLFSLENQLITNKLLQASKTAQIIELPTPNGIQRFKINEASVFADELAAKFPTIKSYVGVGVDDPTARVRLSNSKIGLHAMISSGAYPMYLIDPYTKDKKTAIAYFKNTSTKSKFECLVKEMQPSNTSMQFQKTSNANDGKLRTYRMALIGTSEYSQFHLTNQNIAVGATDAIKKAAVLSAMNTSMTRINGVFERDLGVTMQLVADNDDLIFLNAATDGLTNNDINTLINESQTKCDAVIGSENYDIGHVFGWVNDESGNGLAGGGVVCIAGQKAQGVAMRKTPLGDLFDIDLVAHEIGHQFGANHTQNGDCNRNSATAVEPGSGSTIMGYAGFCDPNVQNNSDAYFHAVSIAEMWNYVSTTATCAVETATNNTAPIANAGVDISIPKSTPFILKGTASDTGNSLTYTWEQLDNQTGVTIPPAATSAVGPLFRSLSPSIAINRNMPDLATVLAGNTSSTWEVLPSVARTMNFAFTVRDNVENGAATAKDDIKITVDGNSGPFEVTSQSVATTLNGDSTQTITWNVANTDASVVNCAQVNILLSTDGGITYPTVLASNTPNDGTQDLVLTNIATTQARIKIVSVNNIFYAVNSINFSIDKTASVIDQLFANFKVYPNPSKGNSRISFDMKYSNNTVVLQLFDLRGRKIIEKQYKVSSTKFSKKINFQSIAKGLYLLKVKNGFTRVTKKILIE